MKVVIGDSSEGKKNWLKKHGVKWVKKYKTKMCLKNWQKKKFASILVLRLSWNV